MENAREELAIIEVIPSETLFDREPQLLSRSRELMPKLLFDTIDVLVIDEMGKDISGAGFDPNVTGRNCRDTPWSGPPDIQKIVCLDLTEKTHGNATGLGAADVITMKLYQRMVRSPRRILRRQCVTESVIVLQRKTFTASGYRSVVRTLVA